MKLTRDQVSALARKVEEIERKKFDTKNKKVLNSLTIEQQNELDSLWKIYCDIPQRLSKLIHGSYSGLTKEKIKNSLYSEKKNEFKFNRQKCEDEILILSIDTDDYETLKKKLKL